jgi:hypothetical protein
MIWPGSPAETAELVGLLEAGAYPHLFLQRKKFSLCGVNVLTFSGLKVLLYNDRQNPCTYNF